MNTVDFIVIRGEPGSGKSFITSYLHGKLDTTKTVVLDPDEIDYDSSKYHILEEELLLTGVDKKFHPYRFLRAQAYKAIEKQQTVIWNQAYTTISGLDIMLRSMIDHAKKYSVSLNILIVEVRVDKAIAKKRIIKRVNEGGHGLTEEVLDAFYRDFEPLPQNRKETVLRFNGEDNPEEIANQILSKLKNTR